MTLGRLTGSPQFPTELVLGRDDSQEVYRFFAFSQVSAGERWRLKDSLQFPTQLALGRDDSREVNRLFAVFDLVSDGEGGPLGG
jgi:hypothetical protein